MIKNLLFNKARFSLGILFLIGLIGVGHSAGFHTPNEILSGNFTGEYNFINMPTIIGRDVQLRVYQSCPQGESIRSINYDGSIECSITDLNETYTDSLYVKKIGDKMTGNLEVESKIGIGGITPLYDLDIVGDVRWSGVLQNGTVPWARLTNIPIASTSTAGIVYLSSSVSSDSELLAATSKAVKSAYDLAASKGTGSVTSVGTGTGLTGGPITTSGTISLATSGVTAGTYTKLTVDAYGRAIGGASLAATDIPNLDAAKITSGTITTARLPVGTTSVTGIVQLSSSTSSTSTTLAATPWAVKSAYDLAASKGTGTVTSVSGGTGLTGTVTTTGSLNLDLTYTDGRYVNKAGDTMTGNLWFTGGTRYIGTTDNNQFRIRTNNADRITILANGNVGIGITNPGAKLDIREFKSGNQGNWVVAKISGSYSSNDIYNLPRTITGLFIETDISGGGYGSMTETGLHVKLRGEGGNNYAGIFEGGNVGIGTTSPGQRLDIVGGYGRVQSGYSWLTNSDLRYKTDIININNTLNKIRNINGVYYNVINDTTNKTQIGVIAQELEREFPQLVVTDESGYKSVAYDKLSAVLIEAVKEQQNQIEKLELFKQAFCEEFPKNNLCK